MSKLEWLDRYEKRNSRPSLNIEYRFIQYLGLDAGVLLIHLINKYYLHELNRTLFQGNKYFYSIGNCKKDLGLSRRFQEKAFRKLKNEKLVFSDCIPIDKYDPLKTQRFIDLQFEEIERLYNSL